MPNKVAQHQGILRVLLIDPVVDDVRRVRSVLQKNGDFRIYSARDIAEARAQLAEGAFDVALIESALWSGSGSELVRFAGERKLDLAVVLLTSGNQREMLPALKLGAHDFFDKQQLNDGAQLAIRLLAAVEESRSLRRRDTMVRWLEREAKTDHLTGVHNRHAFDERLEEACRHARQNREALALIMVNVANTGRVNEAYGHQAGDEMIRLVARGIVRCIRGSDFAARIGGDDFGVIIPGGDIDLARRISRRIAHEVERLNGEEEGDAVPVSVTFGVASGMDCEPGILFDAAERQMAGHRPPRAVTRPGNAGGDDDGPSVA
ncbi:MAG TPA: diguanylate cyclase [Tepidiformaceae bacterium]